MAVLPTDYTDSTTPTGATTEYPATTARGLNATHAQINTNTTDVAAKADLADVGVFRPVRVLADGSQTFTIASGTVTQIAGTTVDGVTLAIGDRILVMGAPASTGVGSFQSTNPGNGVYTVTGNTTNLTVARSGDFSGSIHPGGRQVWVSEGAWANLTLAPTFPPVSTAFTWGTTATFWEIISRRDPATTSSAQTFSNKTIDGASNTLTIRAADMPFGITNGNAARQSQLVVSATNYYITGSNLNLPATLKTGMAVGTRFRWTVAMAKDAAGTGIFQISIYRGTNGTTADTQDVLQTIGTQTAVIDNMTVDIEVVVTTTGATGAYYWAIIPTHTAARITGFGLDQAAASYFSGTVSSVAMNTASLKFGLGFKATTGTPTINVPLVRAQALNIS